MYMQRFGRNVYAPKKIPTFFEGSNIMPGYKAPTLLSITAYCLHLAGLGLNILENLEIELS